MKSSIRFRGNGLPKRRQTRASLQARVTQGKGILSRQPRVPGWPPCVRIAAAPAAPPPDDSLPDDNPALDRVALLQDLMQTGEKIAREKGARALDRWLDEDLNGDELAVLTAGHTRRLKQIAAEAKRARPDVPMLKTTSYQSMTGPILSDYPPQRVAAPWPPGPGIERLRAKIDTLAFTRGDQRLDGRRLGERHRPAVIRDCIWRLQSTS